MGGRIIRALILIDFQEGFRDPSWGPRNNPEAETRASDMLARWRFAKAPIWHVQHLSDTPGSPLNEVTGRIRHMPVVAPIRDEPVIRKRVNSAFIGTNLSAQLNAAGVTAVTICGLTTPHCVSTTARMAANLGFEVDLAHDACAAFAGNADASWRGGDALDPQTIHDAALDQLNGEFARVIPSAQCTP